MSIIGHKNVLAFLDNSFASGSFGHVYCLVGPDGMGKRTIARRYAARLLNIKESCLETHPDFFYLARQEDEKTGRRRKDITLQQVKELKSQLAHTSWLGNYKVALIDEGELLNEESGNAILKMLEEAERVVFFILTTDDRTLLPTIRSRCQMIYCSLVSTAELRQGLQTLGYEHDNIETVLPLAWGRPGWALQLAEDEAAHKQVWKELERWGHALHKPFHERMKVFDDLLQDKEEAVRAAETIQRAITVWLMVWRDMMRSCCGLHPQLSRLHFNNTISLRQAYSVMNDLGQARVLLAANVNPRLLIEYIVLNA